MPQIIWEHVTDTTSLDLAITQSNQKMDEFLNSVKSGTEKVDTEMLKVVESMKKLMDVDGKSWGEALDQTFKNMGINVTKSIQDQIDKVKRLEGVLRQFREVAATSLKQGLTIPKNVQEGITDTIKHLKQAQTELLGMSNAGKEAGATIEDVGERAENSGASFGKLGSKAGMASLALMALGAAAKVYKEMIESSSEATDTFEARVHGLRGALDQLKRSLLFNTNHLGIKDLFAAFKGSKELQEAADRYGDAMASIEVIQAEENARLFELEATWRAYKKHPKEAAAALEEWTAIRKGQVARELRFENEINEALVKHTESVKALRDMQISQEDMRAFVKIEAEDPDALEKYTKIYQDLESAGAKLKLQTNKTLPNGYTEEQMLKFAALNRNMNDDQKKFIRERIKMQSDLRAGEQDIDQQIARHKQMIEGSLDKEEKATQKVVKAKTEIQKIDENIAKLEAELQDVIVKGAQDRQTEYDKEIALLQKRKKEVETALTVVEVKFEATGEGELKDKLIKEIESLKKQKKEIDEAFVQAQKKLKTPAPKVEVKTPDLTSVQIPRKTEQENEVELLKKRKTEIDESLKVAETKLNTALTEGSKENQAELKEEILLLKQRKAEVSNSLNIKLGVDPKAKERQDEILKEITLLKQRKKEIDLAIITTQKKDTTFVRQAEEITSDQIAKQVASLKQQRVEVNKALATAEAKAKVQNIPTGPDPEVVVSKDRQAELAKEILLQKEKRAEIEKTIAEVLKSQRDDNKPPTKQHSWGPLSPLSNFNALDQLKTQETINETLATANELREFGGELDNEKYEALLKILEVEKMIVAQDVSEQKIQAIREGISGIAMNLIDATIEGEGLATVLMSAADFLGRINFEAFRKDDKGEYIDEIAALKESANVQSTLIGMAVNFVTKWFYDFRDGLSGLKEYTENIKRLNIELRETARAVDIAMRAGGLKEAAKAELDMLKLKMDYEQKNADKWAKKLKNSIPGINQKYRKENWEEADAAAAQSRQDYEDAMRDYEDMLSGGITENTLANKLAEGFAAGKTAAEDYADFTKEVLQEAVMSVFEQAVLGPAITKAKEFLEQALSDEVLTDDEIAQYEDMIKNIMSDGEKLAQRLSFDKLFAKEEESMTPYAGLVQKSLTEETAGEFVGVQRKMADDMRISRDWTIAGVSHLLNIEQNTAMTVVRLEAALEQLHKIAVNTAPLYVK